MKKTAIAVFIFCAAAVVGCSVYNPPFDDPQGELSVIGEVLSLCKSGRAFYFGQVRNTGDMEVRDATAIVTAFDGSGAPIGSFQGPVTESIEEFEIIGTDPVTGEETVIDVIIIPIDTLDVDQSGSFSIHSSIGCGSAARNEVSFSFSTGVFTDEDF